MTIDMIVRLVLVIFVVMTIISYRKQKELIKIEAAEGSELQTLVKSWIATEKRDNMMTMAVAGVFSAVTLFYSIYSIFLSAKAGH